MYMFSFRTSNTYKCFTGRVTNVAEGEGPLDVIIYNNQTDTSAQSGFQFTYFPDPIITMVRPLKSILL